MKKRLDIRSEVCNNIPILRNEREKHMNLEPLLNAIVKDFARWDKASDERVAEFAAGLSIEEGRKYLKVVKTLGSQQMVWGFVQKEDDKKFRAGDILKAAGWAAPARNKPRGNVLEGDFSWVRWTGPEYL